MVRLESGSDRIDRRRLGHASRAEWVTVNGSYSVIGGSEIFTITGVVYGLTFVSAQPSTGPDVISLATDPRAAWLVLAACASAHHDRYIVVT
jgi:hypothetical protein